MSSLLPRGVDRKHSNRKFPAVKGRRPDKAAERKFQAQVRNDMYQALPTEEKIKRNPNKLGYLLDGSVA